ncbi:hypothetical protein Ep4_001 [Pseudomonas phage Ep4]|uniref:Uncharacterized protein n=1 Tax=Pseudomonas phage Ep4 TaxID=3057492 RepID=A0AAU9ESR8_9CAUD|nr:hypothetical protein Ep4_001 [Pseudomonas phage Ep4]
MSKFLVGLLAGCLGVLVVTATLSTIEASKASHKAVQKLPEGTAIGKVGNGSTLYVFHDNEAGNTCYIVDDGAWALLQVSLAFQCDH